MVYNTGCTAIGLRVSSFGLLTSKGDSVSKKPRAMNSALVDSPDEDKQIASESKVNKITEMIMANVHYQNNKSKMEIHCNGCLLSCKPNTRLSKRGFFCSTPCLTSTYAYPVALTRHYPSTAAYSHCLLAYLNLSTLRLTASTCPLQNHPY